MNETFHLLHLLQAPPCHIQQRVRANPVCKSSLFWRAMPGCECAPNRSKMPLSLRVILALQVPICTRAASLSLKELKTLQMYLQHPRCSHLPTHRSHHPLAHTTLPGTRESTHNKRPGPATPRRRLGPRSAASFNNDKPLAQLLGPGSPSPLKTWRNAAHLRPPPRVRLPVLSPRAQLPILSATPRFKPGVTRQKRQVPAAPGRPHAPPAAWAGQAVRAFRGTAGGAAAGRGGARSALGAPAP